MLYPEDNFTSATQYRIWQSVVAIFRQSHGCVFASRLCGKGCPFCCHFRAPNPRFGAGLGNRNRSVYCEYVLLHATSGDIKSRVYHFQWLEFPFYFPEILENFHHSVPYSNCPILAHLPFEPNSKWTTLNGPLKEDLSYLRGGKENGESKPNITN